MLWLQAAMLAAPYPTEFQYFLGQFSFLKPPECTYSSTLWKDEEYPRRSVNHLHSVTLDQQTVRHSQFQSFHRLNQKGKKPSKCDSTIKLLHSGAPPTECPHSTLRNALKAEMRAINPITPLLDWPSKSCGILIIAWIRCISKGLVKNISYYPWVDEKVGTISSDELIGSKGVSLHKNGTVTSNAKVQNAHRITMWKGLKIIRTNRRHPATQKQR